MDAKESFLRFRYTVREKSPLSSESPNSDWKERIKAVLGVLKGSSTDTCIFRVPKELRKVNGDAYSPLIVSIGPLIRGDKRDRLTMEEHKWRYMLSFFCRTLDPDTTSDACSDAILKLEEKARESYAEDINDFNHYDLAEIMLVDGCFILELFLRFLDPNSTPDDRIIHNDRMVSNLQHDLALLENQIPFFILQELFKIFVQGIEDQRPASTTVLALSFFFPELNLCKEAIPNECDLLGDSHSHLLDLLHKFYLLPYPNRDQEGEKAYHEPEHEELRQSLIPEHHVTVECGNLAQQPKVKESRGFTKCATKLLEAGIEFKKGEKAHFLHIAFIKKEGDIKIPPLHIDETTKSLLRNLIAFEQCLGEKQQPITSYAILLGSLIQSSPDLELLQKQDIITYDLIEVEDVLTFFKNISRGVVSKDFYFGELCKEVNAYQKSWWHWHRIEACLRVWCQIYLAEFIQKYFSFPWGFLSFLAASLLLILTIMQTYYAARS